MMPESFIYLYARLIQENKKTIDEINCSVEEKQAIENKIKELNEQN